MLIDDYPVKVDEVEVLNELDIDLGEMKKRILNDAHRIIYDFLIYPTFNSDIKNRIIIKYADVLSIPIKRALLVQIQYLYDNDGNIGSWTGIARTGQGVTNIEQQEILTRIICPEAVNILKGACVDILYAGG